MPQSDNGPIIDNASQISRPIPNSEISSEAGLELWCAIHGLNFEDSSDTSTAENTVSSVHPAGLRLRSLALRPHGAEAEDPEAWHHVNGDQDRAACDVCSKAVQTIRQSLWHPERADLFTSTGLLPLDRSLGLSCPDNNLRLHLEYDRCEACRRIINYLHSASWLLQSVAGIKADLQPQDWTASLDRLHIHLQGSLFSEWIPIQSGTTHDGIRTAGLDRPDFRVILGADASDYTRVILSTSKQASAGQIVRVAVNDRDGIPRSMHFAALRTTPHAGSYVGTTGIYVNRIATDLDGVFTLAIFPVDLTDLIQQEPEPNEPDVLGVSLQWASRYDRHAFVESWETWLKAIKERSPERYRSLVRYVQPV